MNTMDKENVEFQMNGKSTMGFDPVLIALIMPVALGIGILCCMVFRICQKRNSRSDNAVQLSPMAVIREEV